MTQPQQITLAVPDVETAAAWLSSIIGKPPGSDLLFTFDPGVELMLKACSPEPRNRHRSPTWERFTYVFVSMGSTKW